MAIYQTIALLQPCLENNKLIQKRPRLRLFMAMDAALNLFGLTANVYPKVSTWSSLERLTTVLRLRRLFRPWSPVSRIPRFPSRAFSLNGGFLSFSCEVGYITLDHRQNITRSKKCRELANEAIFNRKDAHIVDEPTHRNL